MDMELIEKMVKLPGKVLKIESTGKMSIAAITTMEMDLNRLKKLFSAASFTISYQDFQSLSLLSIKFLQLKIEVNNHFQKLKSNAIGAKTFVTAKQINLDAALDMEILCLKNSIESFNSKLFKKPFSHHML